MHFDISNRLSSLIIKSAVNISSLRFSYFFPSNFINISYEAVCLNDMTFDSGVNKSTISVLNSTTFVTTLKNELIFLFSVRTK